MEQIKNLVKRRTVYTDTQLEEFVNGKRDITVMIFRLVYYLNKPIKHKEIKTLESYNNNFQTVTTLLETDYQTLKQKQIFDERFIIN